jgi:hypothetical protein
MASTTFLSNATVNITQGATTYTSIGNNANQVTLTIGQDSLESTAFGDTGHRFVGGLQMVEVSIDFFLSYGGTGATAEVETALAAMVGQGTTTLIISPSGTTESAANPEYTITNAMLESFTPINSTVGELATVTATFTGGTWVRDITTP